MAFLTIVTALAVLSPAFAVAQPGDTIRVKVHDHEIALYRTGVAGPTVILEAGGGSSHRVWDALVPGLAQHARVVTCDRPGYDLSAACDSPRTALRIARELKGQPDPISLIWIEELRRWAARRPATTATVVPGVGHHISRENPAAVIEAFVALTKRQ
jgi:pimeloyl-ACP methyl ester carboxylesterase